MACSKDKGLATNALRSSWTEALKAGLELACIAQNTAVIETGRRLVRAMFYPCCLQNRPWSYGGWVEENILACAREYLDLKNDPWAYRRFLELLDTVSFLEDVSRQTILLGLEQDAHEEVQETAVEWKALVPWFEEKT